MPETRCDAIARLAPADMVEGDAPMLGRFTAVHGTHGSNAGC